MVNYKLKRMSTDKLRISQKPQRAKVIKECLKNNITTTKGIKEALRRANLYCPDQWVRHWRKHYLKNSGAKQNA